MKFDPVAYRQFERVPVGCFSAEMLTSGWGNTKFDHDLQVYLLSDEVSEFIHLVHHFFKECPDWAKLNKFMKKHGEEIEGEDYNTVLAFNYEGDLLDYTVQVDRTQIRIFPYRKFKH